MCKLRFLISFVIQRRDEMTTKSLVHFNIFLDSSLTLRMTSMIFFWIIRWCLEWHTTVIQRLIYEPKNPDVYSNPLKSFHKGLFSSIIANFFFLLIHFRCFSRSIASNIVGNSWYRTKLWTWYFFVNQSINSDLCSIILFSKFEVTQTYRVQFFCDARI